jgi:hypothetical protein
VEDVVDKLVGAVDVCVDEAESEPEGVCDDDVPWEDEFVSVWEPVLDVISSVDELLPHPTSTKAIRPISRFMDVALLGRRTIRLNHLQAHASVASPPRRTAFLKSPD